MALFATSKFFLTLQTVTRQKILTCYYSPRQNFNFFDRRFLRFEKCQKSHVRNVFDVSIGQKRQKSCLKNVCDFCSDCTHTKYHLKINIYYACQLIEIHNTNPSRFNVFVFTQNIFKYSTAKVIYFSMTINYLFVSWVFYNLTSTLFVESEIKKWIRSFQNDSQQDFHSERDKATTPHLDSEQAPETLLFSDIGWEHVRATTLESTLSAYELLKDIKL